jgi:hypothetical protein
MTLETYEIFLFWMFIWFGGMIMYFDTSLRLQCYLYRNLVYFDFIIKLRIQRICIVSIKQFYIDIQ